ncbi:MAG: tRNA (guanosine(37)-N1)-methyltransferase TrmD [Spirochaetaceae bacterium]|jgi:tRNA (guanine37-N1)-methyltransferase|nr:tRNA (guanosine(37)-N1)-methyltransferase TrmD [Spirochaetaceae bacterium]
MNINILSLFPEIIDTYFASSIMAKAVKRQIFSYNAINIRDFACDKHKTCDDAPYGGGAGMLLLPGPLSRALEAAGARKKIALSGTSELADQKNFSGGEAEYYQTQCPEDLSLQADEKCVRPDGEGRGRIDECGLLGEAARQSENRSPQKKARVIYLSPSGRFFDQALARELSQEDELILICGRYEGIDQRIIDLYVDDEISVGDYVLSSGEVAALVVIDAVYRLVGEVIKADSLSEESFTGGLLEYPQWTRPEIFDMLKVPDVLLSGHHEYIRRWRLQKRIEKTLRVRPDLIKKGVDMGVFDEETLVLIRGMDNAAKE